MKTISRNFLILFLILVTTCINLSPSWADSVQAKEKPTKPKIASTATVIDGLEDPKGTGYPDSRKLVRDSKGNLYVAYRKKFAVKEINQYHIFVAKSKDNGKSWQIVNDGKSVERVGDFSQRVPSIAIDSKDVLHIIWYGLDAKNQGENDRQVKYVRSEDGGKSWSKWRNIAKVTGYQGEEMWQEHPVLYVTPDDTLFVVWEGKDEENPKQQIKLTRSMDGGETWDKACCNILEDDNAAFSRPTMVADEGILYVLAYVKYRNKPVAQLMWSESMDQGVHWSKWQFVSPGTRDQRHISAAVDGKGRIHVVWRQPAEGVAEPSPTQIHYAMLENGRWNDTVIIANSPDRYQFFPSLTVDSDDNVWVIWLETADASNFPKDNPSFGAPRLSVKEQGKWRPATTLCNESAATFPSLRSQIHHAGSQVDAIWTTQAKSGDFATVYCNPLQEGKKK